MVTVLVQCNGEAKEAKEQIISLLGQDFPLTAKKLYNLMKKHYMTGTTYHAVYKHLNELVRRGVVIKEGVEYRLSGKWIERSQTFFNDAEMKYAKWNKNMISSAKNIEQLKMISFSSLGDFYSFLTAFREAFLNSIDGNEKNIICWLGNHTWGPLFYMKDRVSALQKQAEKNIDYYIAMRGTTLLDKVMADFYKKCGVEHVKTGAPDTNKFTINIFNDTMLFIIRPQNVMNSLDKIFEEHHELEDVHKSGTYIDVLKEKIEFYVIIVRNNELVESYKNYILSLF